MKQLSIKAGAISPSATLSISTRAKAMRNEGLDVVSFSVGEPDFDTPSLIKNEAIKAINDGFTKYTPTAGILELRKAICKKLKNDNQLEYEPTNIVVSTGAKQALYNALFVILNPGDEVLVPSPYWVSYPEMVKLCDGIFVSINTKIENDLKVTVEELKASLTEKTKAIILNSPSNPSGCVYSRDELQQIADFAVENDLYVISDEIYEKLIYDEGFEHISIASLNDEIKKRTIVINGVSKAYSMTGFRIGYSASNSEIAKLILNIQSHITSNANSAAQKAAVEAMNGDQAATENMKLEFKKRRDYMIKRIQGIKGISAVRPKGAFYVMIDMSKVYGKTYNGVLLDGQIFGEILLEEEKVAVVPCDSFGKPEFIRLSYALSMEDIEKGLARIENLISRILN